MNQAPEARVAAKTGRQHRSVLGCIQGACPALPDTFATLPRGSEPLRRLLSRASIHFHELAGPVTGPTPHVRGGCTPGVGGPKQYSASRYSRALPALRPDTFRCW